MRKDNHWLEQSEKASPGASWPGGQTVKPHLIMNQVVGELAKIEGIELPTPEEKVTNE